MKIKWSLLAAIAVLTAATSDAFGQYTQYPTSRGQSQLPRYSTSVYSPPPPPATPRSTWETAAPAPRYTSAQPTVNPYFRGNMVSDSATGGPVVSPQPLQQHTPLQASPSIGTGNVFHGHHSDPIQTQIGSPAHCATCAVVQRRGSWYGGISGLVMTRDRADNVWLSYDQADIRDRSLNSNDADFPYAGGFGFNLGRYFNCGRNSIQVAYWGVFSDVAEANAYGPDQAVGLDTILHFDVLAYDPGTGPQFIGDPPGGGPGGGAFHFDAERHRVQRDYEIHNIELSLLGHCYQVGCCPLTLGWTAGVRFLRFDESFLYSTDPVDAVFTGAPEELHYGIDTENNLIGVQIGGRADYCLGNRFTLFADTKAGLFGNHVSHNSRIYGSNGSAYVNDPASPYYLQDVNIDSTKDDVAILGQLAVGGNWCINRCWTLGVGYQAIGVSGVALATHQIPRDFIAALDSLRAVDSSGGLILHGGFLRLEYCR